MTRISTPIPAPLDLHRETVRREWIDYNGHMNVAYYVLAFDHATDVWFEHLELGEAYRKRTGCSIFALELHVLYMAELREGDPLRITTQLLGHDDKRLHFFHRMYHAESGTLSASLEIMGLNVEMAARKARPFPADARPRIEAVAAAHAALPRPPEAGRTIGLKRKPST
jgi:acyl-CoA thioester hydrolase